MYKINDMVVYGNEGVCKITDLTKRSFANKVVEYYVLKPVYNEHSIVYIPIDNEELVSKIKRILSVEDIHELIRTLPNEDYCWIENDNQRKEKYREIIKSGNRKELMKKDGKKIHAADDKFFKDAEKVLYDEFAYVLDIEQEDVVSFICDQFEVNEV